MRNSMIARAPTDIIPSDVTIANEVKATVEGVKCEGCAQGP